MINVKNIKNGLPLKSLPTYSVKCVKLLNDKSKLQEQMNHLKEKLYLRKELNKLKIINKRINFLLIFFKL